MKTTPELDAAFAKAMEGKQYGEQETADAKWWFADGFKAGIEAMQRQGEPVGEDEDGMPVGYAAWYNRKFAGQHVDTQRDHYCEEAWRAALTAAGGASR